MRSGAKSPKRVQFDSLWNASSRTKRQQFRNLMRMKLQQVHLPFTEENARDFYMGRVKSATPEAPYEAHFRERDRYRSDRRRSRR